MNRHRHRAAWAVAISACAAALLVSVGAVPLGVCSEARADSPPIALPSAAATDDEIVRILKTGDVARAAVLAEAAADQDAKDGAQPGERAAHLTRLAFRFYEAGTAESLAVCERFFARALALHESDADQDPAALAKLLHDLSGLYFNLGDLMKAEDLERRALTIRERISPPSDPKTAESRRDLGLVFLAQGRLSEAEANLVPAIAVIEKSPEAEWLTIAVSRNYLAELARIQGDYARAATMLEQLAAQAETHLGPANAQFPFFLNNLAGIYRDQERYDEAELLLRRSLALRAGAVEPDAYAIARAKLNLAELYRAQGKLQDAEPLYLQALASARASLGAGNPELFEFVNQLAALRRDQGAPAKAAPLLEEALALAAKGFGAEHPRAAVAHFDLAELLRSMNRCAQATPHYARALDIREKTLGPVHPDLAEVLTGQAQCLAASASGRSAAAARLDRALAILAGTDAHPSAQIDALAARASLRRRTEHAPATADLAAAIAVVERMRPHRGGGERARTAFFGSYTVLYERMVRWEIEDGYPDAALAASERARGRVLLDQLAAAEVGTGTAMPPELASRWTGVRAELAEIRERTSFEESRTDRTPAERARQVADLERRLDDAEHRFREIHDEAMNASPAWRSAAAGAPPSTKEIQDRLVPRKGWLLFYEIGDEASVLFALPPSGPLQTRRLALTPSDAAQLGLPAGPLTSAVLEKILSGGPAGSKASASEGLLARLASPRGHVLRGIGGLSSGADPDDRSLQALWHTLIPGNIWSALRGADQVLVVPDGPLAALPFEALVVSAGSSADATRYWLDDGPVIRYAPSLTFLEQLRKREASRPAREASSGARPSVLSVSDPAYGAGNVATGATGPTGATLRGGRTLPRLPGTARETKAIEAAFEGLADVVVLSGSEAREAAVRDRIGGKRFVHIATHGLVDENRDALFASLALAPPSPSPSPASSSSPGSLGSLGSPGSPGSPPSSLSLGVPTRGDDDGFLQLFEIYDLHLDADLAVLSACGSNAGRIVAGEGVFALSRGFLLSGARRVVATQWSVEDESTAALVGELFRLQAAALASGRDADAARALRDAKRLVRRNKAWAQPFYWAPFVLNGLE